MKRFRKILALILTITFLSSGLTVFADTNAPQSNTQANLKVVNVASSEPGSLDPQKVVSTADTEITSRIMEGLMRRTGTSVVPGIASKYDISKDGLTYTFYLRDALWSDGKAVTANDFAYAWQRALDPKTDSDYAFLLFYIKNAKKYNEGQKITPNQLGIKVINDKTLQVTLESPTPYFIDLTANTVYMPARKDLADLYKEKYFDGIGHIVSNGPFKLSEWIHNQRLSVVKNPTYWNEKQVKIDVINTYLNGNGSSYKQDYLNGKIDILKVTPSDKAGIPETEIKRYFTGATWYVQFNNSDKAGILANPNIRKALALSINRQQFINEGAIASAVPAYALIAPEIIPGKTKSFREEAGNLIKDNDLIAAKDALNLGLKQLKLSKLPAISLLVDNSNAGIKQGETLSKMWKANLGIDIKVQSMAFKDRLQNMYGGTYQIAIAGWGPDYYDAMSFLDIFDSSVRLNNFGYKNTDYNNILNSIRKEVDKSKRIDLLIKAEKKIAADYVVAPLYFKYAETAVKPHIKNYQRSPLETIDDVAFTDIVDEVKVFTTTNTKLSFNTNSYWYRSRNITMEAAGIDLIVEDTAKEAAGMVVVANTNGYTVDIQRYYDLITQEFFKKYTGTMITEKTETQIGGYPAIRCNVSYTDPATSTEAIVDYVIINTPNAVYNVLLSTYKNSYDKRKAEFEKIIQSIKITQ